MRPLRLIRSKAVALLLAVTCLSAFAANDPRPVVGPGATKEEVIDAYGWPNGQSQLGTKEILSYAQGDVFLDNGRVERVNFSPNIPWQAPRPRPAAASASTRKGQDAPFDYWLTTFTGAREEAEKRHCRILALFTGSDWSPGSREFHEQVEYHPDFVNAFGADFVFLKLDYPRGTPVAAKTSEENLALRDRYGVTTYPTLLVLSASGDLLTRVDLAKQTADASFRDRVIAAVREARDATGGTSLQQPLPEPEKLPASQTPTGAGTGEERPVSPAESSLLNAGALVIGSLMIGSVVVGIVLWRMWSRPKKAFRDERVIEITDRIHAAAGGLPSQAEMNGWTREKLCAVTAKLAEFDDYIPQIRSAGGDVDIELRKRGEVKPRVLVCCSVGSSGPLPAKRVRELFGSMAAEGAETGWYVCPAGFAHDAKSFAEAHRIVLIGTESLHTMMDEVPPVSLPRVLAAS